MVGLYRGAEGRGCLPRLTLGGRLVSKETASLAASCVEDQEEYVRYIRNHRQHHIIIFVTGMYISPKAMKINIDDEIRMVHHRKWRWCTLACIV